MTKLITTTPVGKNGQTVVPAQIRKMFKLHHKFTRVGWYVHNKRIEIAPIEERKADYSIEELEKLEKLAEVKGKKVFKNAQAAKDYLSSL
jgi:bifunctional DNA-binding transcriptional regulator/antitoxin component of YhaV-PrlF toxin-antitoxin module